MISIIIPCFNSQNSIATTLSSIVNQTYKEYEIILVDDGSRDNTKEVAEKILKENSITYKYIYQTNSGPSSARNKAVLNASGEYIAFLDADDAWHPQKLELMMQCFEKEEIDILGHSYSLVHNFEQKYTQTDLHKISFFHLLFKNFAVTPSVMMKRAIFEPFDERMKYAEDHELWLRISNTHTLYFLDAPLVLLGRKPLSAGGLSAQRWNMRKGEIQMYINTLKYKKILFFALPFLIFFSLIKHARRSVKDYFYEH